MRIHHKIKLIDLLPNSIELVKIYRGKQKKYLYLGVGMVLLAGICLDIYKPKFETSQNKYEWIPKTELIEKYNLTILSTNSNLTLDLDPDFFKYDALGTKIKNETGEKSKYYVVLTDGYTIFDSNILATLRTHLDDEQFEVLKSHLGISRYVQWLKNNHPNEYILYTQYTRLNKVNETLSSGYFLVSGGRYLVNRDENPDETLDYLSTISGLNIHLPNSTELILIRFDPVTLDQSTRRDSKVISPDDLSNRERFDSYHLSTKSPKDFPAITTIHEFSHSFPSNRTKDEDSEKITDDIAKTILEENHKYGTQYAKISYTNAQTGQKFVLIF